MTGGSLFSGIGGFDLAMQRVGIDIAWQVEIDAYCRAVLAKHWPDVKRYEDVREVGGHNLEPVDLVCGGVPCQPASVAGKRKGSSDERWLWPAFLRVVRELRPAWVLAENPRGIVSLKPHGLPWIIGELEAAGYEVSVHLVGACHVGAPHRRERVWIVGRMAVTESERGGRLHVLQRGSRQAVLDVDRASEAMANSKRSRRRTAVRNDDAGQSDTCWGGESDVHSTRLADPAGMSVDRGTSEPRREALGRIATRWPSRPGERQHEWERSRLIELSLGDPANGISRRMAGFVNRNALQALGNSIVPQVAEVILRGIVNAN